jgi:hypothetical protein
MLKLAIFMVLLLHHFAQGIPRVEEFKCEACDFAIRSWVRSTAFLDLRCATSQDDELIEQILRADAIADPNVPNVCESERVTLAAVNAIGEKLCIHFVEHYPHVKEGVHSAEGDHHEDHEKLFDDAPGYFDQDPNEAEVPTMDERHMISLRSSCSHYLHLDSPHIRRAFAETVLRHVLNANLPAVAMAIDKRYADKIADLTNTEGPESAARFIKNRKRHAVYEAVLAAQNGLCWESCEGDVERPMRELRVRGWSATKRRL